MKLIHCADIHLDSTLGTPYTSEQAKQRKLELIDTFRRMIKEGADEGVSGIIIAGDLFDNTKPGKRVLEAVKGEIENHKDIDFYYLKGNHEKDAFLDSFEQIPDNLRVFDDHWTSFRKGRVLISGMVLGKEEPDVSLQLNKEDINIITLHGQVGEYSSRDKAESISIAKLRGKNIDYLALGHIHEHTGGIIDARGKYEYAGCLEGRSFDECGAHGYILLDIDEENGKISSIFREIAKRSVYQIPVDISDLTTNYEMETKIRKSLSDYQDNEDDILRVILEGSLQAEVVPDVEYLKHSFENDYYIFRIKNNTGITIDYDKYDEKSLTGQFVALVKADSSMDETKKSEVIRYGLAALTGCLKKEEGIR